ncbi:MAG: hypothetical protein FWG02_06565 [Holophagaceae bacterium]|nr:hypothetical protein [Holophagaceae bacterium]
MNRPFTLDRDLRAVNQITDACDLLALSPQYRKEVAQIEKILSKVQKQISHSLCELEKKYRIDGDQDSCQCTESKPTPVRKRPLKPKLIQKAVSKPTRSTKTVAKPVTKTASRNSKPALLANKKRR